MRNTIVQASDDRLVKLSAGLEHELKVFERALEASGAWSEVLLGPGDVLVLDNRRCLHSRSPISRAVSSDRVLLRTKRR
jgi:alpha-ketoglutarate-dependent taurine dioxygenase